MKLIPVCIYRTRKTALRYIYNPRVYGWKSNNQNPMLVIKSLRKRTTANLYPYSEIPKDELLRNIGGIQYFD